jgi:hypothetical protein
VSPIVPIIIFKQENIFTFTICRFRIGLFCHFYGYSLSRISLSQSLFVLSPYKFDMRKRENRHILFQCMSASNVWSGHTRIIMIFLLNDINVILWASTNKRWFKTFNRYIMFVWVAYEIYQSRKEMLSQKKKKQNKKNRKWWKQKNKYYIFSIVLKFVSDLPQVSSFLRVLRFPPPIKLTATVKLNYCWKWCLTP